MGIWRTTYSQNSHNLEFAVSCFTQTTCAYFSEQYLSEASSQGFFKIACRIKFYNFPRFKIKKYLDLGKAAFFGAIHNILVPRTLRAANNKWKPQYHHSLFFFAEKKFISAASLRISEIWTTCSESQNKFFWTYDFEKNSSMTWLCK